MEEFAGITTPFVKNKTKGEKSCQKRNGTYRLTVRCVEARSYYIERMKTVEQVAIATDAELSSYILKGVTEGWSYDILKARLNIPCCKDVYYNLYRRFFWLLNKARD